MTTVPPRNLPDRLSWIARIGCQRYWYWRGWRVRYCSQPGPDRPSPPLLFIHGFGAALEHWRGNLEPLSADHPCYAVDLLGFGGSQKAAAPYGVTLWTAQMAAFVETVIGEPVVVVGNSLGSLVALHLADRHPDLVRGLVMINLPDVASQRQAMPALAQRLEQTLSGAILRPGLVTLLLKFLRRPPLLAKWVSLAYGDKTWVNGELVEILAGPPRDPEAPIAFYHLCRRANRQDFSPPAVQVLARLDLPMALLWGEQDRFVPFALGEKLRQANPHLTWVPLGDRGHCPHDEDPAQFNTWLRSWLGEKVIP
jgi:haloalkane dehalogenase